MFERNIYDHYHLYCEERFLLGGFESFVFGGNIYIFLPEDRYPIDVRLEMARLLKEMGEEGIVELVPTVTKQKTAFIDGCKGYLFKVPKPLNRETMPLGYRLALFHKRGETWNQLQPKKTSLAFFQQWNVIWEKRLDQLERWYVRLMQQGAQTEIDELFILTFPYYLGLCENAIQYIINSRIDRQGFFLEQPTICHFRFTDQTWLVLPNETIATVKLPIDFCIDYPSRDIAEYIRYSVLEKRTTVDEVLQFIEDYSYERTLTSDSWQLIFGRLLFPAHYFSVVEQYYSNQMIERHRYFAEQFSNTIYRERENEQLLKMFAEISPVPLNVEWL